MYSEKELLLDIKRQFEWPVDLQRYHLEDEKGRYWDGESYFNELPEHIHKRVTNAKVKIEYAQKELQLLAKLPWVRMILLTGSVASLNAKVDDDIDVWLIVDDKRIWLTRTFDFLFYTLKGVRRLATHGVEKNCISNKFCFNLYTTPKGSHFKQNTISYAIQLVDAIVLYEQSLGEYKQLLLSNTWISDFFPTWYSAERRNQSNSVANKEKRHMFSFLFDFLELVAGILMYVKMHHKMPAHKGQIFTDQFTTWGSARILSTYEKTQSESS